MNTTPALLSPVPPPAIPATTATIAGTTTAKADSKKISEAKWGKANIAAGWTCIPNILIRRQKTLGLDSIDLNILLHLLTYWWEDENHPHPSKDTLAKAIGISPSTVQRRIRQMHAGGLLKRVERRREGNRSETNLYDLTPLRALLEPHAELELAERKAGHAGRRERMTKITKVPASTSV